MRIGNRTGTPGPGSSSGRSRRRPSIRRSGPVAFLLLVSLFSFSCRKPAAPPPPPPPAPTEAPPPTPEPTVSLNVRPANIERGESATLQWEASNAASVRIEPGVGTVPTSGDRDVTPTSSVTYTATATGPGGTATDIVRVTVRVAPPPREAPPLPTTPEPTIEELFRDNIQVIYFDYDQAEIRADQVGALQNNIRFLRQNAGVRFSITGHADERGSQEYNIGLGDRRANAVQQYLVDQGIGEARINTVSFGEERPVCTDTTERCYQLNRRAELITRQ
jgi:peptidoglycan-associated lipoprotein